VSLDLWSSVLHFPITKVCVIRGSNFLPTAIENIGTFDVRPDYQEV
jgi:hypothetical protein